MCSWGNDPVKQAHKYRCPLKCGRIVSCPYEKECSKGSYGRTIYIKHHADLRFHPRVPRDSALYKETYSKRTASPPTPPPLSPPSLARRPHRTAARPRARTLPLEGSRPHSPLRGSPWRIPPCPSLQRSPLPSLPVGRPSTVRVPALAGHRSRMGRATFQMGVRSTRVRMRMRTIVTS